MPAKNATRIINGFHHVAIRVKDFDATVRFYKEGLGLKERLAWGEGDGRAIMLDAGNENCVEIFAGAKSAPAEGSIVHFALCAADCDAALKRAKAAGATVTAKILENKRGEKIDIFKHRRRKGYRWYYLEYKNFTSSWILYCT